MSAFSNYTQELKKARNIESLDRSVDEIGEKLVQIDELRRKGGCTKVKDMVTSAALSPSYPRARKKRRKKPAIEVAPFVKLQDQAG